VEAEGVILKILGHMLSLYKGSLTLIAKTLCLLGYLVHEEFEVCSTNSWIKFWLNRETIKIIIKSEITGLHGKP